MGRRTEAAVWLLLLVISTALGLLVNYTGGWL